MSCAHCGLSRSEHEGTRRVYIAGRGWQEPCAQYEAEDVIHGIVVPGLAAKKKLLADTFAFAEKSTRDAEAKRRR
jgi:hypothetical protein